MTDKSADKACCDSTEKNLVKATELPLHGNPYPPKDIVIDEQPGYLEQQVATLRRYLAPVGVAYYRSKDILLTGYAHSQSAIHSLGENQNSLVNALVISGSGLFGLALARRKGLFKKLLYGSVFFTGAMAACYREEAQKQAQLASYIIRNKLRGEDK